MLNSKDWKKIDNLPYYISKHGIVVRDPESKYCHKSKTHVKPYLNNKGYSCINLWLNSKCHKFQIHRLLAIYFIPNPLDLKEVNHIDGNPLNNSLDNLEWVTHQQNIQHAWNNGLFTNPYSNVGVKRKNCSSMYHGVSWSKERQKWCVYLTVRKKKYSAGRFDDELSAAKAYDKFIVEKGFDKLGYPLNFA